MNLLLTGPPRSGKTTLARRVAGRVTGARGFTTDEIRDGGQRAGFAIVTLSGRRGTLAHVDHRSPHRVGRYGVNLADLEEIGCAEIEAALDAGAPLLVIDEIGKMELFSDRFRAAVIAAFESPVPLLATIMARDDAFTRDLKRKADHMVELSEGTREPTRKRVEKLLTRSL